MADVRRLALLAAGAVLLAACSGGAEQTQIGRPGAAADADAEADPVVLEPVKQSAPEDVPSALDDVGAPGLPAPLVDPARLQAGGPPPDGIPAIDEPRFERAGDVTWLDEDEAVLSLVVGESARAYPGQILIWHEIVNDTVEGNPVAVTYCPLCNSALAYDRRVADRLVTFGTSGSLYLSALVMYDRQTESLWSQIEGRAIAGVLAGTELERIPVSTVPWGAWREANPDGWVLSRETGHARDYGRNPYTGYDRPDSEAFLLDEAADGRLPPKERIVAFPGATDSSAVQLSVLAEAGALTVDVDGRPVLLIAAPGLASSLDAADVAEGQEIAATGAFSPTVDGRTLTFGPDPSGAGAVDAETGTRWDVLGRAMDGALAGSQLDAVLHLDTFWFAWAAFRPDARLITGR
jgi:hypothetical protein